MASLVALILFVVAFIVRAVSGGGVEADDWVLWFLAGMAFLALAPAVAYVQAKSNP
jgi:hypothetical protein